MLRFRCIMAKISPRHSYTALYYHLVQEIEHANLRAYIWSWIRSLVFFSWLLVGLLWLFNPTQWLFLIAVGGVITLFWVLVGVFVSLLHLIWVGSQDALQRTPQLAAALLTTVVRPHSVGWGLDAQAIENLRNAAEIEQSAADWRGNFVNLIFVGLILGTISMVLQPPAFFTQWQQAAQEASRTETAVSLYIPWGNLTLPPGISSTFNIVYVILYTILILFVLYQLVQYVIRFLSSEAANRIILLACNDALALLQANNLETRKTLTLTEKKQLAEQLGFEFHSHLTTATPRYIDESGQGWYLESMAPSKIRKQFNNFVVQFWKRQRSKAKRELVNEEE